MKKSVVLAAAFAVGLGWARPAVADTVQFDFNGPAGGGAVAFDTMDWSPGNSLLIETLVGGVPVTTTLGAPLGYIPAGTYFVGKILLQMNLGTLKPLVGPPVFTDGQDGVSFFTSAASFDVLLTGDAAGTFFISPGGTFRIYAVSAYGDDLHGTGFATGAATCGFGSSCILEGAATLTPSAGPNKGTTSAVIVPTPGMLDQAGSNNYDGTSPVKTYTATGGTHAEVTVTNFNSQYFKNLLIGTTLAINDTHNNLPFTSVDPSAKFSSNAIANGDRAGAGTPDVAVSATNLALCGPGGAANCINGTGNEIILETDVNSTFRGVASVPEPASLTLLGLGLIGVARRRFSRKAAK